MDADTARELRKIGNKTVRALDQYRSYWWQAGKMADLVKNEIDRQNPWDRVREAIEMQGRICTKNNQAIQRMHRAYTSMKEIGADYDQIKGVNLTFALQVSRHYNEGRLNDEQAIKILEERKKYVGSKHPTISFSWIRYADKVPLIKEKLFDE